MKQSFIIICVLVTILFEAYYFKSSKIEEPLDLNKVGEESVLKISKRIGNQPLGTGTGIYISHKDRHYVLTNKHVCLPGTVENVLWDYDISFDFNSKHEQIVGNVYSTFNLITDPVFDICLIPLKYKPKASYPIANVRTILGVDDLMAMNVYSLTYNRGEGTSFLRKAMGEYKGMVTNSLVEEKTVFGTKNMILNLLSFTYSINTIPGDSGSPVFNFNGELIGLVFASTPAYITTSVSDKPILTTFASVVVLDEIIQPLLNQEDEFIKGQLAESNKKNSSLTK